MPQLPVSLWLAQTMKSLGIVVPTIKIMQILIAIAVEHLCLAATEQGLGTCWVCNFDASQCSTVLGLPEYIEPAVLIPVGYAEDEPVEKKRKMLNEILF